MAYFRSSGFCFRITPLWSVNGNQSVSFPAVFCDIVVCALCIACLYVFAGISALLCDVFRIKWLPLHRRVLYALDLITVIIKQ